MARDSGGSTATRETEATATRPAAPRPAHGETSQRTAASGADSAQPTVGADNRAESRTQSAERPAAPATGATSRETGAREAAPRKEDPPSETSSEAGPGAGDTTRPQAEIQRPVRHWKGTFHDVTTELYSSMDGKVWTSSAAVEAASKEAKAEARSPDGAGLPRERNLGDKIVGENPQQQLGDTRDRRTISEQLMDDNGAEEALPRPERLRREIDRDVNDVADAVSNTAVAVQEITQLPPPGTGQEACIPVPSSGPGFIPSPTQTPDVGSIAALGVVAGVLGWHAYNKARNVAAELSDKIHERREDQHAGN